MIRGGNSFGLIFLVLTLIAIFIHAKSLTGSNGRDGGYSSSLFTEHHGNITACAVFFTYGGNPRYENEVLRSITRLKVLNPGVTTYLVTDNEKLGGAGNGTDSGSGSSVVDHLVMMEESQVRQANWLVRLRFLAKWSELFPACSATISLDSHVTTCNDDLTRQMHDFYRSSSVIGTNYVHSPHFPWTVTPFKFWSDKMKAEHAPRWKSYVPHNFAILFKSSHLVRRVFEAWAMLMEERPTKDDQYPLAKAAASVGVTVVRQPEAFLFAVKSLMATKSQSTYPRFSYMMHGRVTLIHSFEAARVPAQYNGDFCSFVNADVRDRMLWQQSVHAPYELLFSRQECEQKLAGLEPRICSDLALTTVW